jgi:parallel beta-helix repeat protein
MVRFIVVARGMAVLGAMLLLSAMPAVGGSSSSAAVADHGVILIDNIDDFTPEQGVVSGNGLLSDPYIIEGWTLGPAPGLTGVSIAETSDYVVIRNMTVQGCGVGIQLFEACNVLVQNCTVSDNGVGISIMYGHDCEVIDNMVSGNDIGISIWKSSDINFIGNELVSNEEDWVDDRVPWEVSPAVLYVLAGLYAADLCLVLYAWRWAPRRTRGMFVVFARICTIGVIQVTAVVVFFAYVLEMYDSQSITGTVMLAELAFVASAAALLSVLAALFQTRWLRR